jgi:deazaflavin-dependent oxidoreductase (nitroreductase family)
VELAHSVARWLYRGKRPHRFARLANRVWAWLGAKGVGPHGLAKLEVVGRKTGRPVSFPVVVADYEGGRYLVSMLGADTNWVRNVRAAGGQAVLCRGRREPVRLVEVDPQDRPPILRRYLECAPGGRPHLRVDRTAPIEEFETIAGQFPVFRITAREPSKG